MSYDLIIIGGGVNGCGIARDAAIRGMKVLLVEKRDFSSGATGGCSGMIHGGARYMLYDIQTTKKSCVDSGYIQKCAPHMLFRIPFLIPVSRRSFASRVMAEAMETYFEGYDLFQPYKNGKKHTRLNREEVLAIEPGLARSVDGAVTMDEYGIDPFRLCAATALSAAEHGAVIRNHTELLTFLRDGDSVTGVRLEDHRTGRIYEEKAKVIFIACGPWNPDVLAKAGVGLRLRKGKGVHLILDRRVVNTGILCDAADGRQIFIIPHDNGAIVGTTDDDFYGDLDNLTVTEDEIEYLLEGIARSFPQVREARVTRVMVGVRPTLWAWHKNEDKLSRDHRIVDHGIRDGARNLLSMSGGKLAAYRIMSEEAVDAVEAAIGRDHVPCRTHEVPLAGGERELSIPELAAKGPLPEFALGRIHFRHGARAEKIVEISQEEPGLQSLVCPCEPVTGAEIAYACRTEWASKLSDVRRRTRLGTGPCQGMRCSQAASCILAREHRLTGAGQLEELRDFVANRWKGKFPVLEGEQLAQEELHQANHYCTLNLAAAVPPAGLFEEWRRAAVAPESGENLAAHG